MKPSIQKIQKIIKLEADHGYDNRAVIGGLDRILQNWEGEARAEGVPEELVQAIGARLRDYPRLSETSRSEVLEGLWRRLQQETGTSAPPLPPVPHSEKASAPVPPSPQPSPSTTQAALPQTVVQPPAHPIVDSPRPPAPPGEPAALGAPVTVLANVGPKHAQTLDRLELHTLRDMLYYFPRRYDDYSQLKPINRLEFGEEVTVIGTVQNIHARPVRSGQTQMVEAVVSDGSGALRVTWFNQPWIARRLHPGAHISISGKVEQYLGRLVMNSPEWEPLEQQQLSTNRIVPVYSLTAQITQRWLRRLMNQVVSFWAPRVRDPLPDHLCRAAGLLDISTALLQVHFPDSADMLQAARYRLAFDEIFLMQLGVLRQKRAWQAREARVFEIPEDWLQSLTHRLPYTLTGAQHRAITEVRADLASGRPMNRLLQGDVGSGKTVVAALAIAMITHSGAQAALMAPTSILAEQHYKSLLQILAGVGIAMPQPVQAELPAETIELVEPAELPESEELAAIDEAYSREQPPQPENQLAEAESLPDYPLHPEEIRLLVGSTPEAEKRQIQAGLADGSIKLIIGTHALIEEPVGFKDLQLSIIDEQHRFGVEQRASLRSKGDNPHLLVMTATPIPRSLALTVYGDLDLSVMAEMPPGRQPVSTHVLTPRERERAYGLIRSQVEAGRQAFIIYPLVEESDKSDSKAAVEDHARLQKEVFPKLRLGLLHGRLRPDEKEDVMGRYYAGEYQVLVSTSVVEVGVDVPNATVMLIEGANRFGLAQLHQFRGRVGRGSQPAYCLLIPESTDAVENERLQAMSETNDGFILAEKDLEQRGAGDFLGTRQSGFAELQLARLTDVRLIEKVRRHALELFEKDPDLELPQHQLLGAALERFWGGGKGDIS